MKVITRQRVGLFVSGWVLAVAAGCPDGGVTRRGPEFAGEGSATRRAPNATLADARTAAMQVLRQRFRIDTERSTGQLLVTGPLDITGAHGTGRFRDLIGSPNRHRETAIVRIGQEADGVVVRCQVGIERLDTVERAAFAPERGDDRPTATPGERAGPTSPRAREEWVFVGRDRTAETEILDAILQRITGTPAGEEGNLTKSS